MRAYYWFGLLAISVLSGCGGESSLNEKKGVVAEGGAGDEPGDEPGEGGAGDSGGGSSTAPSGGARPGTGASPGEEGGAAGGNSVTPPSSGTGTAGSVGVGGSPGVFPPIGRPGLPGFPLPGGASGFPAEPAVGCEPYSQATGPGYCEIFRQCENTSVYAQCSDQGNGSSSCTCQNGGAYATYAIKAATGLTACETIADLCAAGGEPKVSGEEKCESLYASKSASSCNLQEQCTQSLEGNASVSVITNSNYVECFNEGTGNLYCYCSAGFQYRLSGIDGNSACDRVQELCGGGAEFGEKSCAPSGQSSSSNYCDASYECRETQDLGNGAAAARFEYRYANCQTLSDGVTTCSCGSNTGGMRFDFTGAVSSTSCATAAENCGDPGTLELTGSIDCARASQNTGRDYCSSSLECRQSGKLGDLDVKAYGYLETSCRPSSDGKSWTCGCYSGGLQANTTIETTGDSWADCTAATDKCQGLVEVQIGNSGGLVGRPIPFF